MVDKPYSFTPEEKRRGRKKGIDKIWTPIRAALSGGPHELLDALNAIAREEDYSAEARKALLEHNVGKLSVIEDPRGLAPLWFAMKGIQRMADFIIEERDPQCDQGRYMADGIITTLTRGRDEARRRSSANEATVGDLFAYGEAESNCEEASKLVHIFLSAPEEWLSRLRKCGYEKCKTPYFIDEAPGSHARFCSDKHRVAANRAARR